LSPWVVGSYGSPTAYNCDRSRKRRSTEAYAESIRSDSFAAFAAICLASSRVWPFAH
jgi:hypothetical protein